MSVYTEDAKRYLRNETFGIKDDTLVPADIIRELLEYIETLEEDAVAHDGKTRKLKDEIADLKKEIADLRRRCSPDVPRED